jgi:hypothetical protein
MRIDLHTRAEVLRWASALTVDQTNSTAVAINASPLLAWLEAATDDHDLDARVGALRRHHTNRLWDVPPDDDPDRFVREARTFYGFLIEGDVSR